LSPADGRLPDAALPEAALPEAAPEPDGGTDRVLLDAADGEIGLVSDGKCLFAAAIEASLEPLGIVTVFVDHDAGFLLGATVRDATQAVRTPPNLEWWLWFE